MWLSVAWMNSCSVYGGSSGRITASAPFLHIRRVLFGHCTIMELHFLLLMNSHMANKEAYKHDRRKNESERDTVSVSER